MTAREKFSKVTTSSAVSVRSVKVERGSTASIVKENAKLGDKYILLAPLRKAELSYQIDGVTIFKGVARPGMLRLIAPGEKWTAIVASGLSILQIEIPGQVWRKLLRRSLLPVSDQMREDVKPLLRPVSEVERLSRVLVSSPPLQVVHQEMLSEGVTLSLLAYLFQNHHGGQTVLAKGGLTKKQLVKAIDFAHSQIATKLSINEWSRAIALEPHTFSRRFRRSTGTSPYKWFLEMRLEDAEHLLLDSKLSTGEIAKRVGYTSLAAFIDAFQQKHGSSPNAWRVASRS